MNAIPQIKPTPELRMELRQPVILFVDDEDAILSSIKSLFRRDNYIKYFFNSSPKALEFLEENDVDLIITDMRMPEMNGIEFLERLMDIRPDVVKVILSGYEEKKVILDLLTKGHAHHFLMKPWDDEEFKQIVERFGYVKVNLERQKLIKYLSSFSKLPTPPQLHNKLTLLLSEDNVNINRIVAEIEKHPFLITKLLQISNSVSLGIHRSITSIKDAVILIGVEQLKSLIVSLEILNKFSGLIKSHYAARVNEIWERLMRRAVLARRIADYWEQPVDKSTVFLAALVSDIGYLIWLYTDPEKYEHFYQALKSNNLTLQEAEKKIFLYPHSKLGSILLELWNFHEKIVTITANHHTPQTEDDYVKIIQLAAMLEGNEPDDEPFNAVQELIPKFKEQLKI